MSPTVTLRTRDQRRHGASPRTVSSRSGRQPSRIDRPEPDRRTTGRARPAHASSQNRPILKPRRSPSTPRTGRTSASAATERSSGPNTSRHSSCPRSASSSNVSRATVVCSVLRQSPEPSCECPSRRTRSGSTSAAPAGIGTDAHPPGGVALRMSLRSRERLPASRQSQGIPFRRTGRWKARFRS